MKRIFKRILPIILSLVIICSAIWYLFVYDRGFMQDILLGCARYLEQDGNHAIATWLYNQAYLHSGNDAKVIIELSERFKKIGNYTQAEVVLSNAIAENASADLYVALCKTYVEQDKLTDAVRMLDNITNPQIKAELDSMRPAVPVAAPAPGYYTQYMNVTISGSENDRIFVATDGDFPSVKDTYTEGITLVGGENKIYVIAVDEQGLVSEPAYFSYIVGGVIEEVTISDPALDKLFRDLLYLADGDKLFSDDLWEIKSLTVPKDVTDLSDLSRLAFLEHLVIEDINFEGLQMLSSLTRLKDLTIRNCPLSATALATIGNLPNLETLTLNNCSLSNISGLSNAKHLKYLDISGNAISDLSPLSFLENLSVLNASSNALTSLSPLSALKNLTELDVSYNSLVSLAPLATCPKLSMLSATNNRIASIPVFDDPSVLTALNLADNELTNLDTLPNYICLETLDLSRNQISDVSKLSEMRLLSIVNLSHNNITTLPSWSTGCELVELDASYNKITSVAPLGGLGKLNYVTLDYNKITNINPLADCHMLVRVSVYGNSVRDVSKLTAMSVIVNYSAT